MENEFGLGKRFINDAKESGARVLLDEGGKVRHVNPPKSEVRLEGDNLIVNFGDLNSWGGQLALFADTVLALRNRLNERRYTDN